MRWRTHWHWSLLQRVNSDLLGKRELWMWRQLAEQVLHFISQNLALLVELMTQDSLQLAHFNFFSLSFFAFGVLLGLGFVTHGILHQTGVLLLS